MICLYNWPLNNTPLEFSFKVKFGEKKRNTKVSPGEIYLTQH